MAFVKYDGHENILPEKLLRCTITDSEDWYPNIHESTFRHRSLKPGHFAFAKLLVVIDESEGNTQFEYDIWKRFVVGEPVDVRCNFGQTVKMKFKGMKRQQSINYTDIPKMVATKEKVLPKNLCRRTLAAELGKAKLVGATGVADEAQGVFAKVPPNVMED